MGNREKFRALCKKAKISQREVADLIAEYTHRPCSIRTVRSWLAPDNKISARPCPDWSIDALEIMVVKRKLVDKIGTCTYD